MKALDTNVLVRYLVQDDPNQATKAAVFIETHCPSETPCFIGQIVLCELVWVLEGNYSQRRSQISQIIEGLLQFSQLEVMDGDVITPVLREYTDSGNHLEKPQAV